MIQYEFECDGCERYVLFETTNTVDAFECPCGNVTRLDKTKRIDYE